MGFWSRKPVDAPISDRTIYYFDPLEDITAYELALIWASFRPNGGNIAPCEFVGFPSGKHPNDQFDDLYGRPELGRHFVAKEPLLG